MKPINNLLRNRRKEKHLTMKDVANAVGVSEATVSRWESGEIANMGRSKIYALSQILELSPAEIMGIGDEHKKANEITLANHEKKVILAYRDKPEMQPAVDRLLGVEEIHTTPSVRAARSFGDKSKIDRNADIDEQRFIDAPENDIDM